MINLVSKLFYDKAVCRTAPSTPGLLIILDGISLFVSLPVVLSMTQFYGSVVVRAVVTLIYI